MRIDEGDVATGGKQTIEMVGAISRETSEDIAVIIASLTHDGIHHQLPFARRCLLDVGTDPGGVVSLDLQVHRAIFSQSDRAWIGIAGAIRKAGSGLGDLGDAWNQRHVVRDGKSAGILPHGVPIVGQAGGAVNDIPAGVANEEFHHVLVHIPSPSACLVGRETLLAVLVGKTDQRQRNLTDIAAARGALGNPRGLTINATMICTTAADY